MPNLSLIFRLSALSVARMQNIKTIETQVPFLKESFFTSTFKSRRKSSVSNILRKQQHSLLSQHQQQCILEQRHKHSKQPLLPSADNRQGQRGRATSIPLCKTTECAGADGAGKEGQHEGKAQRLREAAQWRKGEHNSTSVAVSATFILASEELGEAASLTQLSSAKTRKPRSGSPERALTSRAAASPQEDAQSAQSRPQQHGLLAKGVRLLRNMGNQEAKQKKADGNDGASGDVTSDAFTDDQDKKAKKSHNKMGRGGGEHGGKKKSKSDSKASVFSGLRKSLAKAKGSKEDVLEDGRAEPQPAADANLLANETDLEEHLSLLSTDHHQFEEETDRKRSSGSDTDLYSFHSAAAENEDLLSGIQQALEDHDGTTNGSASKVTAELTTSWHPQDLDQEGALHCVNGGFISNETRMQESEMCVLSSSSSGPESLCESAPLSSDPDTEKSSVSLFPKTNSTYSFPDTTATSTSYESTEAPQDEPKSLDLQPEETENTPASRVKLEQVGGAGLMGSHKSVSSMDLSITKEEEGETWRRDFLSLKRRKSSLSISQLTSDTQVLGHRRTSSSSPSTVKMYPPIHPSYVKTTTRQLASPAGSPLTSPHVHRKTNTVELRGDVGFNRHKQRSSSITGPIDLSADWCSDHDTPENGFTGGTYWTLGSKRAYYARRTSNTTPTPYLDVFSGESDINGFV